MPISWLNEYIKSFAFVPHLISAPIVVQHKSHIIGVILEHYLLLDV